MGEEPEIIHRGFNFEVRRGWGEVAVHVSLEREDDNRAILRFAVTDTGIGVAPHKKNSLFDAFTQADASTSRKYGGTGLGLAICKRLVELMGGQIDIESEPGQGSTFWFTAEFEKRSPGKEPLGKNLNDIRGQHILLAEDNLINQKVALKLLEKMGYKADVVANGKETLRALEMLPYDLVLLDVQMPEMDGFQAARLIRDPASNVRDHDVTIVAMTAHAMKGDREKCLEAGMDDYLSKPVQPAELAKILKQWISAKRTRTSKPLDAQPFDAGEFLNRYDDVELLRELVDLFLSTYSTQLSDIRQAVDRRHGKDLEQSAHKFKNSLGCICANVAMEVALRLEMIGRDGDLAEADGVMAALDNEISRLEPALAASFKDDHIVAPG